MASVLKRFHHFKSSPFHGGSSCERSQRTPSPSVPPMGKEEEEECAIPSDLLNRRKVSISKSGRYKENHRKRSALPSETKDLRSPSKTQDESPLAKQDETKTTTVLRAKDKEEKNKENERNRENLLVRRDSSVSDMDGHAVADEIESLAKTLTIEHALETAL